MDHDTDPVGTAQLPLRARLAAGFKTRLTYRSPGWLKGQGELMREPQTTRTILKPPGSLTRPPSMAVNCQTSFDKQLSTGSFIQARLVRASVLWGRRTSPREAAHPVRDLECFLQVHTAIRLLFQGQG